jgi:hypothetical protein
VTLIMDRMDCSIYTPSGGLLLDWRYVLHPLSLIIPKACHFVQSSLIESYAMLYKCTFVLYICTAVVCTRRCDFTTIRMVQADNIPHGVCHSFFKGAVRTSTDVFCRLLSFGYLVTISVRVSLTVPRYYVIIFVATKCSITE